MRAVLVGACVALAPHAMRAQPGAPLATLPPPGAPLSLDDVLRTTLTLSVDLRGAQSRLVMREGSRRAAGAPYATQLKTFVLNSADKSHPDASPTVDDPALTVVSTVARYGVTVTRQFRSGISVSQTTGVTRSDLSSSLAPAPNRASASVSVVVPLLRGRGVGELRGNESAAVHEIDASISDVRHSAARSAYNAALAYWDYVAAARRLDVQREAEARAQRLVGETRVLVQADERAPSELQPVLANEASTRVARITAEQSVREARARLALAIGLPAEELERLGAPATDFPAADSMQAPTEEQAAVLARAAVARRADLRAAQSRQREAEAVSVGLTRDLRPQLDLVVGSGFTGTEYGGSVQPFYSSLYRRVAGPNTSVQLTYTPPIGNALASGRAASASAQAVQAALAVHDATRNVVSGATIAASALRNALAALATSEEAVALSRTAVESELSKFRLGTSTRFEVIQAEQSLTNALLGRIAVQNQSAQALARVRFESGQLLTPDEGGVADDGDTVGTLRVETARLLRARTTDW